MKKLQHLYFAVVIGVLSSLFSSCSSPSTELSKQQQEAVSETTIRLTKEQLERSDIRWGQAALKLLGAELKVNGMIDVPPQNHVSISMPYGGFLEKITVLPGSQVKKGQLLVRVSNPEFIQFQQDYLECVGRQEYLKAEYERQQELHTEQVNTSKVFQQAKSDYLINEARMKSGEEKLRLIGFNSELVKQGQLAATVSIFSPITGSVREVLTNVGKYIHPQDVILNLTNADDLHVELTVYERDVAKVHIGQTIHFSVANNPEEVREAEVFLVGSDVRADRSVTVHGHLKKYSPDLLPGMYVSAIIQSTEQPRWSLPETAFARFDGKDYIFKVTHTDNQTTAFELLEVKKGVSSEGFCEVLDTSFSKKDSYALTGVFSLLSALKNKEEED